MADKRDHIYVPVLKLLQGERDALRELSPAHRKCTLPLLEVHPPKWKKNKAKKIDRPQTMEELLNKVGQHLAKALGHEPALIDGLHLAPAQRMASGAHPLAYLLLEARKAEVQLVPVTGPERSKDYQDVVRAAVEVDKRGVCVRLRRRELFADDIADLLETVLTEVGTSPSETDLVLDVGQVDSDDVSMLSKGILGVIASLPRMKEWRTLVLTAGAFPQKVSHIVVPEKLPRADWSLWKSVKRSGEKGGMRLPIFGDYAVQGTMPATPESSFHSGSPNIRYTADDHWLVVRGQGFKRHGHEQYHELARFVREHACYAGREFSWGDAYIFNCAGGADGPGTPSIWRQVGTNHHVAQVLSQLTNRRVV